MQVFILVQASTKMLYLPITTAASADTSAPPDSSITMKSPTSYIEL